MSYYQKESDGMSEKFDRRRRMTYADRAQEARNPALKALFGLMEHKKTTLALANDDLEFDRFLPMIEKTGDHVAVVKTHMDLLRYPSFSVVRPLIDDLQKLAEKYGFMIFEDRKFADIGKIVLEQYIGGPFRIAEWAHLVNAHSIPGPGVIEGLYEGAKPFMEKGEKRGLIMLAQMTPKGNLFTEKYAEETIAMAEAFPEFAMGYIGTGSEPEKLKLWLADKADPNFLIATPGVKFGKTEGKLGQRYEAPEKIVANGSDLLIVGSGIYESSDPECTAREYRKAGWDTYNARQRIS
jgi:orotidine 5'-phosphate decarboxylase subfamily 1